MIIRCKVRKPKKGTRFDTVPAELKSIPQWCVWKYLRRGTGKPTKPPYSPITGKFLKPSNIKGWVSFERAVTAYKTGKYEGIGFLFTSSDHYFGVDIDHCINSKTGKVKAWAQEIIDLVPTYWEISPSGTGVKGFMVTEKSFPVKKHKYATGEVEAYYDRRYFTVTGNHLPGTPKSIRNCTSGLSALYKKLFPDSTEESVEANSWPEESAERFEDDVLLRNVRAAENGAKFVRLYDEGDILGYPSESEASLGLCNLLAFWAGPNAHAQVLRLFESLNLPHFDGQ